MELLVVGDPHLSHKRIKRSEAMLKSIAEEWHKRLHIREMVILGDVFDEHEWVHAGCLSLWEHFLDYDTPDEFGSHQVIQLLGNHELIHHNDYLPKWHALKTFWGRENCTVVDRPRSHKEMLFMPYVPQGSFAKAMAEAPEHAKAGGIMFCHQEFQGSLKDDKGDARPGDEWKVISGHIHETMRIGNVWYPGAPAQTNFGEANDKAIYVIEILDGRKDYRIKEKISLGVKQYQVIEQAWDAPVPSDLDPEWNYYRFDITAKRSELSLLRASERYREMLSIGKVKLTPLPEVREKKSQFHGVTFRKVLEDLLITEDLKEVTDALSA